MNSQNRNFSIDGFLIFLVDSFFSPMPPPVLMNFVDVSVDMCEDEVPG